jgi:transcriptional regulator with XRE-family HTH domain
MTLPGRRSLLGQRVFQAHLELSYQLGRKVTLAEFGRLIAKQLGRRGAFSAAAVSRWESGLQAPTLEIIEAIAALTGTDPGWISHGPRSAAPAPRAGAAESAPTGAATRGARGIRTELFAPVARPPLPQGAHAKRRGRRA